MSKTLLAQTTLDKIFGKNKEIRYNWTGQEMFDIYFGVFFN